MLPIIRIHYLWSDNPEALASPWSDQIPDVLVPAHLTAGLLSCRSAPAAAYSSLLQFFLLLPARSAPLRVFLQKYPAAALTHPKSAEVLCSSAVPLIFLHPAVPFLLHFPATALPAPAVPPVSPA